jgi:hypothetical protein
VSVHYYRFNIQFNQYSSSFWVDAISLSNTIVPIHRFTRI